jgi:hypothetical protein
MTAAEAGMSEAILRIGVIADTHVPERAASISSELLEALTAARVDQILHAGDICWPRVLEELSGIAPVMAVRGNRDMVFGESLPAIRRLDYYGVRVALLHGSGTFWQYVADQFAYIFQGYRLERYLRNMDQVTGDAQVIVFGHTHRPVNETRDGRLYFNPGSASFSPPEGGNPSFGILTFSSRGDAIGEIIPLTGAD